MANRPAGAGAHSAGPQRGPAAAPPPVHHQGFPRSRRAPGTARGVAPVLAWLPYLIVLAGVAVGMFIIWEGSQHASRGAAVVGGALLAAAVARLVLPPRCAGLLASRGRALDVAVFAMLGAAVLGAALSLL
jgi:Protein of unknown function (DUF3017)